MQIQLILTDHCENVLGVRGLKMLFLTKVNTLIKQEQIEGPRLDHDTWKAQGYLT
jgi:hypothetical protein